MTIQKIMLGIVLAVSGACIGAARAPVPAPVVPATRIAAQFESADKPSPRAAASWQRQHARYVERAKQGDVNLYMLGDSITDFWGNPSTDVRRAGFVDNWNKNLGGWKVADFGISGDMTQHVLWRILNGELDGVKPKVIVLMIGTNNLPQNSGYTPEQTAGGVKAILNVLQEKQPQATILLFGIFPRQDFTRTQGVSIMDKIDKTNQLIATYADGKRIRYTNINQKFFGPDGNMLPDVTFDMLHPNPKGYQIWADALRSVLTELLGEPKPVPATATAPGA